MADNQITIVGNVTRDPEIRYLSGGSPLATFSIAVNHRFQKQGEWTEETSYFDVTAWRDLAENVTNSISKGNRVVVIGRLDQRTWETDAGEKRSKIEIVADEVAPSLRWAVVQIERSQGKKVSAAPVAHDDEPF